MTSDCMSLIERKFYSINSYLLGSNRISRNKCIADYNTVVSGLTLWYGVILDYNSMLCTAERESVNRGRILKHVCDDWSDGDRLVDFLSSLDTLNDILIKNISRKDGFKGHLFHKEISHWEVSPWLHTLKGCILGMIRSCLEQDDNENEVRCIRFVRQIASFLKKIDVDRPDLEDEMQNSFFVFEEELAVRVQQQSESDAYRRIVSEMRNILYRHLDSFSMEPFVPGHGPGAVSDPTTKTWFDKNHNVCSDQRIGYLLGHACLGSQSDYLPFIKVDSSTRTSRYICVPKTWKTLRGISAEPTELQFWQQGVLFRINSLFHDDKWWRKRINLHDQGRSRSLALSSSVTGDLATIDLSSASDSVTLQLVRDLFGNTHLGRWLLGTRSVFTVCRDTTIRIQKFAPMGSSCCFPVECMIFCLAAEVAVRRTRSNTCQSTCVCVYGDDIIAPSYSVPELLEILSQLGFTVNTEKSFWEGNFRESCGIEAWAGHDISPCRFRRWRTGIRGQQLDYDEYSSLISLANELFSRGLHDTRRYLLLSFFRRKIKLKNGQSVRAQSTVFTSFSGVRGTLASPNPTNFNLLVKFDRALQTLVYKRVVWREKTGKSKSCSSRDLDSVSICEYTNWLIRHQPGVLDFDKLWSKGWIESIQADIFTRLPLGLVMVPTYKWVLPPVFSFNES